MGSDYLFGNRLQSPGFLYNSYVYSGRRSNRTDNTSIIGPFAATFDHWNRAREQLNYTREHAGKLNDPIVSVRTTLERCIFLGIPPCFPEARA